MNVQALSMNKSVCSWCHKTYQAGDDFLDRMEWCETENMWALWNGETIHRKCDYDRYDFEMELRRLRRQPKITNYFYTQRKCTEKE